MEVVRAESGVIDEKQVGRILSSGLAKVEVRQNRAKLVKSEQNKHKPKGNQRVRLVKPTSDAMFCLKDLGHSIT